MAKFSGNIGYVDLVETDPGIWEEQETERHYCGDFSRNISKFQLSDSVNNDINVSNEISIVADPYAKQNFQKMRYITFMGSKWKIASVEVKYPRLILSIGGLYNG